MVDYIDQIPYIQSDLLTKIGICLIDHVHKSDSINRAQMQLIVGCVIMNFRKTTVLALDDLDGHDETSAKRTDEGWHW